MERERAKPLTADERRAAIVAATKPLLLSRHGEVTTKQIAEAAGVAEGTIFRVFPTKRELFLAVLEETVRPRDAADLIPRLVAAEPDLESQLRAVVAAMVAGGREVLEIMISLRRHVFEEPHEGHRPTGPPAFVEEASKEQLEQLREVLFAPHAEELRISPDLAARTLRSLVLGVLHPGQAAATPLSVDQIVDIVLHGIERD